MRNATHKIALGGVLAALAVVIMTMGGLIPVATYVCPMLCSLILFAVVRLCGNRIGWAWYSAVSVLSLMLAPDKEAVAVFVGLGYYPIIKPYFDRLRLSWLWKAILFNAVTSVLYAALMYVFGMSQLITEFHELGILGLLVTLILGNVCFFLLDRLLFLLPAKMKASRKKHRQ
jgi:hypothetical protein